MHFVTFRSQGGVWGTLKYKLHFINYDLNPHAPCRRFQKVRTIAIETSGPVGGVALVVDGQLATEEIFEKGMVHGRELAPAIKRVSEKTSTPLEDVDLIAVDVGERCQMKIGCQK